MIGAQGSRLLREKRRLKIPQDKKTLRKRYIARRKSVFLFQGSGILPRKLKRCPRKATARSANRSRLRKSEKIIKKL
ncbi:hypothetical protein [Aquibacillus halophilus]|uniref:hypothetical protein n=1 Tax=Aquibacillus halophilus TaxID=930132 RepID=UPI0014781109|nr:hypothetical protein [Aquibacillus halophilus]